MVAVMKGMARTVLIAMGQRYGEVIGQKHPLYAFATEHAAQLRNRHQVGQDGHTAMEMLRGRGNGETFV